MYLCCDPDVSPVRDRRVHMDIDLRKSQSLGRQVTPQVRDINTPGSCYVNKKFV